LPLFIRGKIMCDLALDDLAAVAGKERDHGNARQTSDVVAGTVGSRLLCIDGDRYPQMGESL
jgi:hypothetical protein